MKQIEKVNVGFFKSNAREIINENDIETVISHADNELINRISEWISEGSGWVIKSVKYEKINFPVKLKDIQKIGNMNDIKFIVFSVDDKESIYPLYISKTICDKTCNLILIENHYGWIKDHLFGKELLILFAASAFRKLSSIYVFSYFPFGFEGRIWDLIVSVPDHCLSFYFQ